MYKFRENSLCGVANGTKNIVPEVAKVVSSSDLNTMNTAKKLQMKEEEITPSLRATVSGTDSNVPVVVIKELQAIKNLTLLGAKTALNMDDAVLLTGLSKSHLYKLVCAKQIPYYKAHEGGKITYFNKDELTSWMLHRRIKTNDEVKADAVRYTFNNSSNNLKSNKNEK